MRVIEQLLASKFPCHSQMKQLAKMTKISDYIVIRLHCASY